MRGWRGLLALLLASLVTSGCEAGRRLVGEPPKKWGSEAEALAAPIIVGIKSGHFFGPYDRDVPDCPFQGRTIGCKFKNAMMGAMPDADALWWHAPSICGGQIQRDAPHQYTVVMSMEASTYYGCLDKREWMDQFDIEMTYRRCSHVQVPYFYESDSEIQNKMFADPLPWEKRQNAIAYINSNCGALNGRNELVRQLMGLNKLEVHAWGGCLRNKVAPSHNFEKVEVFRQYKFCIAMENSNVIDYVTEKIWHALESGCLPIYQGAPNMDEFMPLPNAYIDYNKFGTPEKLMDYLVKLSQDKEAFLETQRWRYLPLDQLSPGFRKLVLTRGSPAPHTQCQLCQLLMQQRLAPRPLNGTHCLRNATWLAARKAAEAGASNVTTWGPGSDAILSMPHAHRWSKVGVWDPLNTADPSKPRAAPDATIGKVPQRKRSRSRALHAEGEQVAEAAGDDDVMRQDGGGVVAPWAQRTYDGGRRRYGTV